jgi:PIN like domain
LKILIDNDLPPQIAVAMNAMVERHGHSIIALRHKFRLNTPDVDWIATLGGERGWSVISNNFRITRVANERQAWRQTDLVGYFLAPAWRKIAPIEQAARLLLWWPKLEAHNALVAGGSAHELPINAGSKIRQMPV